MLDELEKLRRTVKLVDEMFPEFYETRGRSQTMTAHLLSQV
jgi:hypothetical protein